MKSLIRKRRIDNERYYEEEYTALITANIFQGFSNCCNALVYGETDICSQCHEYCEVIKDD